MFMLKFFRTVYIFLRKAFTPFATFYSSVQYSTVQCSTLQYSKVQCSLTQFRAVPDSVIGAVKNSLVSVLLSAHFERSSVSHTRHLGKIPKKRLIFMLLVMFLLPFNYTNKKIKKNYLKKSLKKKYVSLSYI